MANERSAGKGREMSPSCTFFVTIVQAAVAVSNIGFVVDYFSSESVRIVTSTLCDEETNVWLYKRFSDRKIRFDCLDLNSSNETETLQKVTSRFFKNGILVDLKCPWSWDFLKLANKKELFTFGNGYWLILTSSRISKETLETLSENYVPPTLDLIKYLTEPYQDRKNEKYLLEINRKINADVIRDHEKSRKETKKLEKFPANKTEIDDLLEMKILQYNQMSLAVPEILPNGSQHNLFSVYKDTEFSKIQIHEIGRTGPEGLRLRQKKRRNGLGSAVLRATTAVFKPEIFTSFDNLASREEDVWTKISYPHLKHLSEDLNFRIVIRFFDGYGWKTNDTFSYMMGFLQQRKADVSAAGLLMREDRMVVIDYLECGFHLAMGILFREPPLSSVTNIFILPFAQTIWISIWVAIVLIAAALHCRIAVGRVWIPPDENLTGFADVGNYVAGAVCQQGFSATPKSPSARILVLILLLTSLALFTSYSACIVALLQSPSSAINTVEDLTRSDFEAGVQSQFPLFRVIMKETTDPDLRDFYRRKVLPKGENAFYDRRVGIERMRRGMFAFEVELIPAYKVISETYKEKDKCGIRKLSILQKPVVCMVAPTKSPYKELFTYRFRWQDEVGLFHRTWKRWTDQKPKCKVGRAEFISVGLNEFKPALQVFGYGVAATVIVFIGEVLFGRKKNRSTMFRANKNKLQRKERRRFRK